MTQVVSLRTAAGAYLKQGEGGLSPLERVMRRYLSVIAAMAVLGAAVTGAWAGGRSCSGGSCDGGTPVKAAGHKGQSSITQVAAADANFSTLVSLLKATGLDEVLADQDGEFTVFAPTNTAFAKLPKETLASLARPENAEQLKQILTYHVVKGAVTSDQLSDGEKVKTVSGKKVTVRIDGGSILVNASGVTKADIKAGNGVIHVIDTVLLPPAKG
jgi:uncharacterized surface protein with fasciclin (FAS1) repeats